MLATQLKRKRRCLNPGRALGLRFLDIKSGCRPINTGASSSLINSNFYLSNRLSKVKFTKDGEAASITYLHNALGQRIFKGEPKLDATLPNELTLGATYIDWLKKNFQLLFTAAQANTSVGTAYSYGDSQTGQSGLPE